MKSAGDEVTSANGALLNTLNSYADGVKGCATVACFDSQTQSAADAFTKFGDALGDVSVPAGGVTTAKSKLLTDADVNARDMRALAEAASYTQFLDRSTPAEKAANSFDKDYGGLAKAVNAEVAALNRRAGSLNIEAGQLNDRAAALNVPAVAHLAPPLTAPSHSSSTVA